MFHDLSYGANNDLTSVVAQLAVIEMLGRMKKEVWTLSIQITYLSLSSLSLLSLFLSLSLSPSL